LNLSNKETDMETLRRTGVEVIEQMFAGAVGPAFDRADLDRILGDGQQIRIGRGFGPPARLMHALEGALEDAGVSMHGGASGPDVNGAVALLVASGRVQLLREVNEMAQLLTRALGPGLQLVVGGLTDPSRVAGLGVTLWIRPADSQGAAS
jgi:hypothetical protein